MFSVPQKALKGLINQVHFAMAVHDICYYLIGMLFVAEGKNLTLVATDGHRLALAQVQRPDACRRNQSVYPHFYPRHRAVYVWKPADQPRPRA